MRRVEFWWVFGALAALAALGCDNEVTRTDAAVARDGGSPPGPVSLTLEPPGVLSWPLATIRGEADGAQRVLVRGAGNPFFVDVLPDDSFCVDVRLESPGAFTLELLAQSADGFSEPVTTMTEFDPSAPEGMIIPTCTGADPRGCGSDEICDNGLDDDCDSAIDASDPDCDDCADDLLEPNDAPGAAPRIPPDTYAGLVLCPGDEDHYAVFLREGETLDLAVRFTHAEGDIDVALFDPADAMVASGVSTDDDETISHAAAQPGEHRVRVYQAGGGAMMQSYAIELMVAP